MKYVCDGRPQCPLGEDELNCCKYILIHLEQTTFLLIYKIMKLLFTSILTHIYNFYSVALSNGREMFYDIDDSPKINLEGYLTKRTEDDWQVVCEDNLSVDQQERSATHICHYLGFR